MIGAVTGTRAVIAAVGVALVLGVAACSGDDPEPKVAPSTASGSSSPSASGVDASPGPEVPAVATELSRIGAERFVDYWFRALSYGMTTGDTRVVGEISSPGCGSCHALIQQIEDLYARGGRVKTAGWAVEGKTIDGQFDSEAPSFLLRVNEASRVLLDGRKIVDRTPMAKIPMHIQLARGSEGWTVADLEIIE
jgi:hypothetical protein